MKFAFSQFRAGGKTMKKLLTQGLLAATLLSLSVPALAADIILNPSAQTPVTVPQLKVIPGPDNRVDLQNYSNQPLTFSSPQLNLSYVVPANTERVIYLDPATVATLTPGQSVAYYINDAGGNQIASSTITNDQIAMEQFEYRAATTTQETTPATTAPESRSTVRGFW
jgi:hypothetical protein